MPIYEYRPKDPCNGTDGDGSHDTSCPCPIDLLRKRSEADDPVECPSCGKGLSRCVAASNFSLKGGGWAKDGYSG